MKNTLINYSLIGLLVSLFMACSDGEWSDTGPENTESWRLELEYINATGETPIEIDYYSLERSLHFTFIDSSYVGCNKDTSFLIGLNPAIYDSIFVSFPDGRMYKCYRDGNLDDQFNMCHLFNYVDTIFAYDHRRSIFTFTREMFENAQ